MAEAQEDLKNSPRDAHLLRLVGIGKSFPGVRALNDVHLEVKPGEVHALVGENGAGKSTLMKILSGAYTLDQGEIYWKGQKTAIRIPKDAQDLGIAIIYQEFNLVPDLSIAENVWLGREIRRSSPLPLIDWPEMYRRTESLLQELNINLDPRRKIRGLGVAHQQMVEIAKALSLDARLLIMDEPTSALADAEITALFDVIRSLKARGVSVIFISHHLDEVFKICDRLTVLRDGEYIGTAEVSAINEEQLITMMVGRTLEQQYPKTPARRGEEALRVEGLTRRGKLADISFCAYTGEILGIAGLVGAGRTELVRTIFAADPADAGKVYVFGKLVRLNHPYSAIHSGMGLLPEDRKQHGLIPLLSVNDNISMASLDRLKLRGLLQLKLEREQTHGFIKSLRIATPSADQQVQYLSGGNQQKVVLAKWLASRSKVLIFDEPTRGIDVGAKVEVYNLMNSLIEEGVAVIMVSSEMPELLGMSDRIIVMHEGELVAEYSREEATQEKILAAAMGVDGHGES